MRVQVYKLIKILTCELDMILLDSGWIFIDISILNRKPAARYFNVITAISERDSLLIFTDIAHVDIIWERERLWEPGNDIYSTRKCIAGRH